MSGQRNKKPSDVIKNRQDYLDNLSLQVQLNDANEQAVKQFVSTGQVPPISQMKDTRSTSDILLDVEKLKINLIKDLEPIADPQFAQQIVQRLVQSPLNIDNGLLVFTAQRIDEIVKNLKKLYKYGIKGDANDAENFVSFINKMFVDKNKTTQSVKSFTSRMDKSTGVIGSIKSTDYYSNINSAFADFSSVYKSTVIANKKIKQSMTGKEKSDLKIITDEIENINAMIRDKFKGLLGIIPKESMDVRNRFYTILEQTIINLQGDPKYDLLSSEYERYLNFINRNIPNLNFSDHVLGQMNNNLKNVDKVIATKNIQSFMNYYTTLLNYMRAYDGLLDVDIDEIEEIEIIYKHLRKATNDFSKFVETPEIEPTPTDYYNLPITRPRTPLALEDIPYEEGGEEKEDADEDVRGQDLNSLLRRIDKNNIDIRNILSKGRLMLTYPEMSRTISSKGKLLSKGAILLAKSEDFLQKPKTTMNAPHVKDIVSQAKDIVNEQEEFISKMKKITDVEPPPLRYEPRRYEPRVIDDRKDIEQKIRLNKKIISDALSGKYGILSKDHLEALRDIQQEITYISIQEASRGELNEMLDRQRITINRLLGIKGHGLAKMSGRGLTRPDYTQGIEPSARYIKFGRYMINNKKLNDNVLSLRRSKGSTIATIPATKMTSELGNVIKKIVGGGVPSYDELNKLTDAEKKYLYKVSQEADIYDKIKIPTPCKDEEEKDIHLFNVMKGEIMAGNNSKELISKFKNLLNKLSRTNVLPKSQVREILEELLELGF